MAGFDRGRGVNAVSKDDLQHLRNAKDESAGAFERKEMLLKTFAASIRTHLCMHDIALWAQVSFLHDCLQTRHSDALQGGGSWIRGSARSFGVGFPTAPKQKKRTARATWMGSRNLIPTVVMCVKRT